MVKQKSAQAGESQFSAAQKAWSKTAKKQDDQNKQNTKAREKADAQAVRAAVQFPPYDPRFTKAPEKAEGVNLNEQEDSAEAAAAIKAKKDLAEATVERQREENASIEQEFLAVTHRLGNVTLYNNNLNAELLKFRANPIYVDLLSENEKVLESQKKFAKGYEKFVEAVKSHDTMPLENTEARSHFQEKINVCFKGMMESHEEFVELKSEYRKSMRAFDQLLKISCKIHDLKIFGKIITIDELLPPPETSAQSIDEASTSNQSLASQEPNQNKQDLRKARTQQNAHNSDLEKELAKQTANKTTADFHAQYEADLTAKSEELRQKLESDPILGEKLELADQSKTPKELIANLNIPAKAIDLYSVQKKLNPKPSGFNGRQKEIIAEDESNYRTPDRNQISKADFDARTLANTLSPDELHCVVSFINGVSEYSQISDPDNRELKVDYTHQQKTIELIVRFEISQESKHENKSPAFREVVIAFMRTSTDFREEFKINLRSNFQDLNANQLEIHHLIANSLGGADDVWNAIGLTPSEHSIVHIAEELQRFSDRKGTSSTHNRAASGAASTTMESRLVQIKNLSSHPIPDSDLSDE